MVPPEFVSVSMSFAQPHPEPFHLSSWPTAHVLISASDTSPDGPPPIRPPPADANTPVMSPPEFASAAHAHAVPLHFRISVGAHDVSSDRLTLPVLPPPTRPVPATMFVMLLVPVLPAAHVTVPSALTAVTKLFVPQVPVTRCWRSAPVIPPTLSASFAVPARIEYGTLSSAIRLSIGVSSYVTLR